MFSGLPKRISRGMSSSDVVRFMLRGEKFCWERDFNVVRELMGRKAETAPLKNRMAVMSKFDILLLMIHCNDPISLWGITIEPFICNRYISYDYEGSLFTSKVIVIDSEYL